MIDGIKEKVGVRKSMVAKKKDATSEERETINCMINDILEDNKQEDSDQDKE